MQFFKSGTKRRFIERNSNQKSLKDVDEEKSFLLENMKEEHLDIYKWKQEPSESKEAVEI
jgi:hypothetical protein